MATVKQALGTRNALTVTGFSTLAAATYVASNAYTMNSSQNTDCIIEVDAATTNTPAGNKQIVVFLQDSLDGTNFRSGPTSGTTTTDEPNLRYVGTVPMNSSGVTEIGTFSVAAALGYVPYAFKVVLKNDLGVALTSGAVYTAEQTTTVA